MNTLTIKSAQKQKKQLRIDCTCIGWGGFCVITGKKCKGEKDSCEKLIEEYINDNQESELSGSY